MTEYNEIKSLKTEVAALKKTIKENSSAPRLSYSSIHDGGVSEYDADGNLVSRLGIQHDGTHGAVDIFGPVPPPPTDPTLAAAPVSLTITWDGHVIDEIGGPRPLPLDFQCVQILASQTNNPPIPDDLRGVITSEAGGSKSLTVPSGAWYVALRTRAKSGRMSEQSSAVSITVPSTVDVGVIEGQIADAQAEAAAALSAATESLFIGSTTNLAADPNFETLGTAGSLWGPTSASIIANPTGGRDGGTSLEIDLDGTDQVVTAEEQWKRVPPNSYYRISMWINSSVTVPAGGITSYIQRKNAAGVTSEMSVVASVDIPASTWTFVTTSVLESTANDTVAIRPVVRVEGSLGSTGSVRFDQVTVAQAATGALIVDGSITAAKIGAQEILSENIQAGAITGELLAGEVILGSTIKTSAEGQRVQIDHNGIKLFTSDDVVRVDLPTEEGADASFRGAVQADGLVVRNGATFYSTFNEFARDSTINLAQQVEAPISSPIPTMVWDNVQLEQLSLSGALGTFALDYSQITCIGPRTSGFYVVQQRNDGARVWHYDYSGNVYLTTGLGFLDYVNSTVTGYAMVGSEVYQASRAMSSGGTTNNWTIKNLTLGHYGYYSPVHSGSITLGGNGTELLVGERNGTTSYRCRRIQMVDTPNPWWDINILEDATTTGSSGHSVTAMASIYRGAGDMGTSHWVLSQRDSADYRAYSSATNAYSSVRSWPSPTTKQGATYHPDTGLFYSVGADGRLYAHSNLYWTSSSLDTWYMGQTFYDSNATGGVHETSLGAVTSFTMAKRAKVQLTLSSVPFSGEVDDPNEWRVYGKRGTAPIGDNSDMFLQGSGSYLTETLTMSAYPLTSGSTAPVFGNFPGGTPAILRSNNTFVSDPTMAIFEARGDGSGRWGPLEISNTGTIVHPIPWTSTGLTAGTNVVLLNVQYMMDALGNVRWRGTLYAPGTAPSGNGIILTFPTTIQPSAKWTDTITGIGSTSPASSPVAVVFGGTNGSAAAALNQIGFRNMANGTWPASGALGLDLASLSWNRS